MTLTLSPPDLDPTVAHYDAIDRMPQWVVYRHPLDYPNGFVARMHFALPVGLYCLDRFAGDDPAIVEVWI